MFGLFDRGTSDVTDRGALWNGAAKSEGENSEGDSNFKKSWRENNFEVEKLGAKIL